VKGRKTGGRDFGPNPNANPAGRPPLAPELKEAREFTRQELMRVMANFFKLPAAQIKDHVKNPDCPSIEAAVGKVLLASIEHSDYKRLGFLLEQMLGKPKQTVEFEGEMQPINHLHWFKYMQELERKKFSRGGDVSGSQEEHEEAHGEEVRREVQVQAEVSEPGNPSEVG
jgi:hypothetical protein